MSNYLRYFRDPQVKCKSIDEWRAVEGVVAFLRKCLYGIRLQMYVIACFGKLRARSPTFPVYYFTVECFISRLSFKFVEYTVLFLFFFVYYVKFTYASFSRGHVLLPSVWLSLILILMHISYDISEEVH